MAGEYEDASLVWRHRVLHQVATKTLALNVPTDLQESALARINVRLAEHGGGWGQVVARRNRRRPDVALSACEVMTHDEVEGIIVASLSLTSPVLQFSVTPTGAVFAGASHGYHQEHGRFYVSGMSPSWTVSPIA